MAIGLLSPGLAASSTFVIINLDSAGEGFNDPTPLSPVGGNTGTTIGAQRLQAFQFAANLWGSRLTSEVAVRVEAQFNPLTCNSTSAVLGAAGPISAHANFTGAPFASTWYASALANALHRSDLEGAENDIDAIFNSSIGTTCSFPKGWYYGLDANPPTNQIDFVTVLLHELGHGLGFLTFVDLATGAKAGGLNDAFMRYLENHGATPPNYPAMSNAQRVAASISTGNLHWTGGNLGAASAAVSAGTVGDHVRMFAPNPQQPGSSVSHFDTALTPNQLMEPSYAGPNHNPLLELALFKDIGWRVVSEGSGIRNDLLIDFGGSGLWELLNNATWAQVHGSSPIAMAIGDLDNNNTDEVVASFSGSGLWVRYNSLTWINIHNTVPVRFVVGDFDASGKDDLAIDFGGSGIWMFGNNSLWSKLHPSPAEAFATGDLDGNTKADLIIDFGEYGLWGYFNNATWRKLHAGSPTFAAVGDLDDSGKDDLVLDFGGSGLWALYNNATWVKLHTAPSQGLATGDLDDDGKDEVVADLGNLGVWARYNNVSWIKLHDLSPSSTIIADLDNNGMDDLVIDFGNSGLWGRFNNSSWVKIHPAATQGFAAGGFD